MYTIERNTLTGIADAIRNKTGKNGLIKPKEMVGEIEGINGLIETETGILTLDQATSFSGTLLKQGVFASLNGRFTIAADPGINSIATVPEGFRSVGLINAICGNGATINTYVTTMTSDGKIYLVGSNFPNYLNIRMSWLIPETVYDLNYDSNKITITDCAIGKTGKLAFINGKLRGVNSVDAWQRNVFTLQSEIAPTDNINIHLHSYDWKEHGGKPAIRDMLFSATNNGIDIFLTTADTDYDLYVEGVWKTNE